MKTWIVVVNRSEAKIFESDTRKNNGTVRFVEKVENPRGRMAAKDINADKPGVLMTLMGYGTRLVKSQSPTDRVSQVFAKELTDHLEGALRKQNFDSMILIAPPQFLGKMRTYISKDLRGHITREISKDLGPSVTAAELQRRLWPPQEARFEL